MFFRLSSAILMLALVALGTPVKRTAATVESDIGTKLTAGAETLSQAVENFKGTSPEVLRIHDDALQLMSSFQSTTTDTNACPEFTDEETEHIGKLLDDVVPVVQTGCNALVAKKTAVTNAGALNLARTDLCNLSKAYNSCADALLLKSSMNFRASVQSPLGEMEAALTNAMNAYGVVCSQ